MFYIPFLSFSLLNFNLLKRLQVIMNIFLCLINLSLSLPVFPSKYSPSQFSATLRACIPTFQYRKKPLPTERHCLRVIDASYASSLRRTEIKSHGYSIDLKTTLKIRYLTD